MSKAVTILNSLTVLGSESENLRKALICWPDQPEDSLNLVLKFLGGNRPSESLENLLTTINCWGTNPSDAMIFLLRMLDDESESTYLENLRIAWANYSTDPRLAFHSLLKALSEPMGLKKTDTFMENLRVGFIQLDENPRLAFNLILKAIEESDYPEAEDIRKGFLAVDEGRELDAINHLLSYFCRAEDNVFVDQIRKSIQKFPEANWTDAFSFGQIDSKLWLLDEWRKLDFKTPEMAFVLGGWYGLLPAFAEARKQPLAKSYRSFDLDTSCVSIAETINKAMVLTDWKFKATTMDIHDINYRSHDYETLRSDGTGVRLIEKPDLVINTSCEHIHNYSQWYAKLPMGTLLILQSNNYLDDPTHINCSDSLATFKATSPMSECLYAGEKLFPLYTRFMLIGRK